MEVVGAVVPAGDDGGGLADGGGGGRSTEHRVRRFVMARGGRSARREAGVAAGGRFGRTGTGRGHHRLVVVVGRQRRGGHRWRQHVRVRVQQRPRQLRVGHHARITAADTQFQQLKIVENKQNLKLEIDSLKKYLETV